MEEYRAIPQGYMTVGEVAKRMGTTVRALQYYDKKGVFAPSFSSEGGRRLYTEQDVIKLQQILIFRELNMNLGKIKSVMQRNDYDTKKVLESQKIMLEIKKGG